MLSNEADDIPDIHHLSAYECQFTISSSPSGGSRRLTTISATATAFVAPSYLDVLR